MMQGWRKVLLRKKTEEFQGLSLHGHKSCSLIALSQLSGSPRPALTLCKEIASIEGTPKLCAAQSILEARELGSLHIYEQFSERPITYLFAENKSGGPQNWPQTPPLPPRGGI